MTILCLSFFFCLGVLKHECCYSGYEEIGSDTNYFSGQRSFSVNITLSQKSADPMEM